MGRQTSVCKNKTILKQLETFWHSPTNFYMDYSVSLRNVSHSYFNDVLTTFLGLESFSCVAVYAGSESSWISSKELCSEDERQVWDVAGRVINDNFHLG